MHWDVKGDLFVSCDLGCTQGMYLFAQAIRRLDCDCESWTYTKYLYAIISIIKENLACQRDGLPKPRPQAHHQYQYAFLTLSSLEGELKSLVLTQQVGTR